MIVVIIITEDDLSNVYTVEEAVDKIGFGIFQALLSLFSGAIMVGNYLIAQKYVNILRIMLLVDSIANALKYCFMT